MKLQIICLNPDCLEVPIIRLTNAYNGTRINTNCSIHHYEYKLEEYLSLLEKQEKGFSEKCIEHNENYIGYSLDTNLNVCMKCLIDENKDEKIAYFNEIEISDNKRVLRLSLLFHIFFDFDL